MKIPKINLSPKLLIVINSATILISLYKITTFILEVGRDLFAWWIPMGKIFSYIHFWLFVTFFCCACAIWIILYYSNSLLIRIGIFDIQN